MANREMFLSLDEDDYRDIQAEFARQQRSSRWPEGAEENFNPENSLIDYDEPGALTRRPRVGVILPDGDSNLAGAMIAEVFREVLELQSMLGMK